MHSQHVFVAAIAAVLLTGIPDAWAQAVDPEISEDEMPGPGLHEGRYLFGTEEEIREAVVPIGGKPEPKIHPIIVEMGAGVANYTDNLGAVTGGGLGWSVRGILGARGWFAGEIGYTGASNQGERFTRRERLPGNLDPVGERVVSNTGEALARVNFGSQEGTWRPFVAGGAGYFRLDSNAATLDGFEAISFPVAGGVQIYPKEPLSIGLRATYSFLTDFIDDGFPTGDQWGGMLTAGANF